MPTYEYACSACGHEWEQTQRIVDPPVDICPKCAKSAAHRLISRGTNFILKGGGWYSDLYASPGAAAKKPESDAADAPAPAGPAKAAGNDGARPSPPPAATTDAKPAANEAKPAPKGTTSTPTTPSSS